MQACPGRQDEISTGDMQTGMDWTGTGCLPHTSRSPHTHVTAIGAPHLHPPFRAARLPPAHIISLTPAPHHRRFFPIAYTWYSAVRRRARYLRYLWRAAWVIPQTCWHYLYCATFPGRAGSAALPHATTSTFVYTDRIQPAF